MHFEAGEQIIRDKTRCGYIILLLRGEFMSFEGFTNRKYHKPGAIIGVNELLFGLNWGKNLVGRQPGQFLKLTREGLLDIFKVASKTGAKILKEIIHY